MDAPPPDRLPDPDEAPEANVSEAEAVSEVLAPEGDQTAPEGAQRVDFPWADSVSTSWDAFDFTAYEQFAEVDGRKLNYVDLGEKDKPVLLYVHGIMGTWRNWIFNLLPFADRYRVIAIDLPGFGLSEMPAGKLTLHGYARAVKTFCDQLGLKDVTLIGNSMGGHVGALVAKNTPEILKKLVLVDAAGFSTSGKLARRTLKYAWVFDPVFKFGYRVRKLIAGSKQLTTLFTKIVLWRPLNISTELILVLLAGIGKPGFAPAAASIGATKIDRQPGEITTETMIIWGREDWLIPKRDAFRYARMLPEARLEILEDVGHIPMFETPEQFNALIEDFAADKSAAPVLETTAA